jgi:hypothetical protein
MAMVRPITERQHELDDAQTHRSGVRHHHAQRSPEPLIKQGPNAADGAAGLAQPVKG